MRFYDGALVSFSVKDVIWSQQAGSVPLRFKRFDTEMGEYEFQRPVTVSVESRFGISLSMDEMMEMVSVSDIQSVLDRHSV